MKLITTLCILGLMQFGFVAATKADDAPANSTKSIRDELMDIDKTLNPLAKKVVNEPEVKAASDAIKAAGEAVKTAKEKYVTVLEDAIIKADPTAKDLLDRRKKLVDQLRASMKPAPMAAPAPAPAPAPATETK